MKTNKQTFMARKALQSRAAMLCAIAIIALALSLTACDNGNNDPDPCDCTPAAHLGIDETCSCGGTGCECTEQKATLSGTTIVIRKEEGITVAQMNAAIDIIQEAYDDYLDPFGSSKFEAIVTEVQIVSGNTLTRQGGIIKIGIANDLEDVGFYFGDIASDTAQVPQSKRQRAVTDTKAILVIA